MKNVKIYLVLATDGTEIENFENAYESYDEAKKFIFEDMKRREIETEDLQAHFEYDYKIKEITLMKKAKSNLLYQVNMFDDETGYPIDYVGTYDCKHKAMQAIKNNILERGYDEDDFEHYFEDYEIKLIES